MQWFREKGHALAGCPRAGVGQEEQGRLRVDDPREPSADAVRELARRSRGRVRQLVEIVATHKPQVSSIESIFFAKDASATAKLGHARGVAMLVCVRAGMEMFEYPPTRVKRTVTGSGKADKSQVARMMMAYLRLTTEPPADAADALAVSATHLQSTPFRALAESSGAVVRRIG